VTRAGGEEPAEPAELLAMLEPPFPAERMRVYPVSMRVNAVRNDDEGLIEEVVAGAA
jgi:putative SOS response-associated peptidase YedK